MKKKAFLLIFVFTLALTSCKAKKGCGLTGDTSIPSTNPIEKIAPTEIEVVS